MRHGKAAQFTRRSFLKISAAAGGLTMTLGQPVMAQSKTGETIAMNAWVSITPDNLTTIMVSQAEMGQGVQTTLPAIIAEELCADWTLVTRQMAPVGQAYVNPVQGLQFTGNAESTRSFWGVLRMMGASTREVLTRAAAARWNVPLGECFAKESFVYHQASNKRLSFGELAADAAKLEPSDSPKLKDPSEWTLLRNSIERVDLKEKITGAPIFGIDFEIEGLVHAAIQHAPTQNGEVAKVDRSRIADMKGIVDIVEIPGAVIVVADSYWRARKALIQLAVEYRPGPHDDFSTADLDELYQAAIGGDAWTSVYDANDASSKLSAAEESNLLSADYWSAWQSHAPMEPMNCTAFVDGNICKVWAPTQGQGLTVVRLAEALNIPPENVSVERTYLGGGFGRRLLADFAVEAALASRAVGRPVKLIWSREEDMRHGHYRPGALNRIEAALDADGFPIAMDQKLVTATILSAVIPATPEFKWVYPDTDPSVLEGLTGEGFRYGVHAMRLQSHLLNLPVKTMVWRTTGYGPNVFAIESFIDELAHKSGRDPYLFRRHLLEKGEDNARAIAVLDMLADKSGWGSRKDGRAMGMAFSHCFETYIGQVAEVSVDDQGMLDIHKITTVLDGGYVLDPDITLANIQGGIVWGLSQALSSEITFANGAVQQSNFHDFKILQLAETPPTEFHFIDSGANPGGLGEVGPVPTTPALTNAIFAASGKRIRSLPIANHGIHTRYAKQFV